MLPINQLKVELKYKIGYTKENPSKYDILYEIAEFLQLENKDEFNEWELKNKTKSRFGTLEENVKILIEEGFIEKEKYTKYKLLKHLWM
jgi:predicted transcriptional regulator